MAAPPAVAAASAPERAALLLITALACLAYAWRIDDALLEPYYAAAVRSMALDWRNFAFGAFDPDGTLTLDKLPGAFWLQALSVRIFGAHVWAVVLPQVIEGGLTVLVLHRAVRRLAGPGAALAAAGILAVSPVTVALNRGNISDTAMTLLLVLAADATSSAVRTGRTRDVVAAAIWVGLAFHAKMLQAWLVLPALGLTIVVAAPGSLRRRLAQIGAAGLVTVAVSLSWMTWVSLVPPERRPFVDGSVQGSVFEQVFAYNGFRRIGGWSPLSHLTQLGMGAGFFDAPAASWNRLLTGAYGRATGWLLPAAVLALVAALVTLRRQARTDPVRAGVVLWGAWLVIFGAAFSATSTGWPYYAAVLSPAIGALLGIGLSLALPLRDAPGARTLAILVAVIVAVSVAYARWLLPGEGTGLPGWTRFVLLAVGIVSELLLVTALVVAPPPRALATASLACAMVAGLLVPTVASWSVAVHRMGPFDTPFQPEARTASLRRAMTRAPDLERAERIRGGARYLLAAHPAGLASRFIFHGGQKVLPIGGLTGIMPEPSLAKLQATIARGAVHLVLAMPSDDPRYAWIASHCTLTARPERTEIYYCRPADVARSALPP